MAIMVNEGNALEAIIPFDSPKHPRLPANRFPKAGKAGLVVQAGRVIWITGKYLYKYRKKWLAFGGTLASGGLYLTRPNGNGAVPKRKPTRDKFNKAYPRYRGGSQRSYRFDKHVCKRCRCPK